MSQRSDDRVRPSAWWYAVPVVVWAAAIVVVVAVVWSLGRDVMQEVDAVEDGTRVDVPAEGLTIYSTRTFGDSVGCEMVSDTGVTPLDPFGGDLTVSTGDSTWRAVGSTPADLPAGSYELSCERPSGQLGVGTQVDVSSFVTRIVIGIVVPLVLGLIGLIVLIVVIVKRHQSVSRLRSQRAAAAGGGGGSWPTYGAGPPPPPGAS